MGLDAFFFLKAYSPPSPQPKKTMELEFKLRTPKPESFSLSSVTSVLKVPTCKLTSTKVGHLTPIHFWSTVTWLQSPPVHRTAVAPVTTLVATPCNLLSFFFFISNTSDHHKRGILLMLGDVGEYVRHDL